MWIEYVRINMDELSVGTTSTAAFIIQMELNTSACTEILSDYAAAVVHIECECVCVCHVPCAAESVLLVFLSVVSINPDRFCNGHRQRFTFGGNRKSGLNLPLRSLFAISLTSSRTLYISFCRNALFHSIWAVVTNRAQSSTQKTIIIQLTLFF